MQTRSISLPHLSRINCDIVRWMLFEWCHCVNFYCAHPHITFLACLFLAFFSFPLSRVMVYKDLLWHMKHVRSHFREKRMFFGITLAQIDLRFDLPSYIASSFYLCLCNLSYLKKLIIRRTRKDFKKLSKNALYQRTFVPPTSSILELHPNCLANLSQNKYLLLTGNQWS